MLDGQRACMVFKTELTEAYHNGFEIQYARLDQVLPLFTGVCLMDLQRSFFIWVFEIRPINILRW